MTERVWNFPLSFVALHRLKCFYSVLLFSRSSTASVSFVFHLSGNSRYLKVSFYWNSRLKIYFWGEQTFCARLEKRSRMFRLNNLSQSLHDLFFHPNKESLGDEQNKTKFNPFTLLRSLNFLRWYLQLLPQDAIAFELSRKNVYGSHTLPVNIQFNIVLHISTLPNR